MLSKIMDIFKSNKNKAESYYDLLEITPWSEYQAMTDKYKKIVSFTVNGIDDLEVLDALLSCNVKDNKQLPPEIKKKIKATGITLGSISTGRYTHISSTIHRFWQLKESMSTEDKFFSEYCLITSDSMDKGELVINHTLIHKNDLFNGSFCPPNFFNDSTNFRVCSQKDLQTKYRDYKNILDVGFMPEADFDFNVPLYLYTTYGIKK